MRVYNVEKRYTGSLHSGFSPKVLYTSSEVDFPVETGVYNIITPVSYAYTSFPHGKNLRNHFMMGVTDQGFPLRRSHQPHLGRHWERSWSILVFFGGNESRGDYFAPVIIAETRKYEYFVN